MSKPKYRFSEFNGDWNTCTAGDILDERKTKQKITDDAPLLAFAAGQGVIDRSERKTNNRDFLTNDMENKVYLLTEYDDIVYNPANLKYGAIDRNTLGRGVISPIYVTFTTQEVPKFVELLVKSYRFQQRALQYEEGSVVKLKAVKPDDFIKVRVDIPPTRAEQQKIADFFELIDKKIKLQEDNISFLESQMKGLMNKLLTQELRFTKSDGSSYPEWDEGKIKDFCVYSSSSRAAGDATETGDFPLYDANEQIGFTDICVEEKYISIIKDGSGVGRVRVLQPNTYCIGTMGIITPKPNITFNYMYYVIANINFQKYMVGGAIPHIYFKDYGNESIKLPTIEEQEKIAECLATFDQKIEVERKILSDWQSLKRGMMQKMFL